MNSTGLYLLVAEALKAAVDDDADAATHAVCEIGARSRPDQFHVFIACTAFAEAARHALVTMHGELPDKAGAGWALQLRDGMDPEDVFAQRFIVAHANGDDAMKLALWRTALERETTEYVQCVAAVLANAAVLVKESAR